MPRDVIPYPGVEFVVMSATTSCRFIVTGTSVAVDVSTSSSDRGLARPMLEKIEATYGKLPKQHLVDGGFGRS